MGHSPQRSARAQQPPDAQADLRGFPARELPAGDAWWRAHRDGNGPWFFASAGTGRFDLPEPEGTCYLADTPQTAARELIGPEFLKTGMVTGTFLAGRSVSRLPLPEAARAADLTAGEAFSHRVGNELSTLTDYELSRSWACALRRAGFDAICYQPRFSPGPGRALGLFGAAGPGKGEHGERVSLREVVERMSRVRIVSPGLADEYEIIDEAPEP